MDGDNTVSAYNSIMTSLVDKHAPETSVHIKSTNNKSWYNDEVQAARKVRCQPEPPLRKSGLEVHTK
jgi:hypothetical protein